MGRENSVELKTITLDADSMWDFIIWLPYAIGIVALLRFARGLARLAHRTFLRKPFNLQERYGENSWACITGGSDGVGRAMAHLVAKQGLNIVLVARNKVLFVWPRAKYAQEIPSETEVAPRYR